MANPAEPLRYGQLGAGGRVHVESDGVHVTDEAGTDRVQMGRLPSGDYGLQVVNAGATVIIDGRSNMFKIAATGTFNVTGPNATGGFAQATASVTIATGFTYRPSFLGFIDGTTAAFPNPNFTFTTTGVLIRHKYLVSQVVNTNETRMFWTWDAYNVNDSASTHGVRYHILQEAAF